MKIRIGSRKSDLARLMAGYVGEAIKAYDSAIEIEYVLKSSEGDRDRITPLWALSDKGAFTRDLSLQLEEGSIDMAVHSWKDLPLETDLPTVIAGTLPRADSRDVFFVPKDRWEECVRSRSLKVLSSSPRRAYNLDPFLREALPASFDAIEFESVRGNIPSRVRKLLDGEGDGLLMAKAAIDRLLSAEAPEFVDARRVTRELIDQCLWMITPLSGNPCAPAQGAIAIETARGRDDIIRIVNAVSCARTMQEVRKEREILGRYGGGCHQKIGAAVLVREYGTVTFVRGLTDGGEVLDEASLQSNFERAPKTDLPHLWPEHDGDQGFFERREIACSAPDLSGAGLLVSRANALPAAWEIPSDTVVWAAGMETWRKLAKRGIWVNGCADGLGEDEPRRLDHFVPCDMLWYKLAHADAPKGAGKICATYELVPRQVPSALKEKTHFFWKSASQCKAALEAYPELKDRRHACGPGNSYTLIREMLGGEGRLSVALSFEDWKREVIQQP